MSSAVEELESTYRKAVKTLEGETRAATKKAKGTKGKKAKEAIAAIEAEHATKLQALKDKLEQDKKEIQSGVEQSEVKDEEKPNDAPPASNDEDDDDETEEEKQMSQKERKLLKARRKKERQREREAQRKKELEEEAANAGPSLRDVELGQLEAILNPLHLAIATVEADGHCMYRAIAAQIENEYNYIQLRSMCADTLASNMEDFAPFCEYDDKVTSFEDYVERVRSTAEWGGHLELRALSMALQRPMQVYSVSSGSTPLTISAGEEGGGKTSDPVRLSYHLHFYALGEHYNRVVDAPQA